MQTHLMITITIPPPIHFPPITSVSLYLPSLLSSLVRLVVVVVVVILIGVRSAAITTMPPLLTSALHYLQKNAATGADRTFVRNLFHFMLPTLLEEIKEELDMEVLALAIEALSEVSSCCNFPMCRCVGVLCACEFHCVMVKTFRNVFFSSNVILCE